MSLALSLYEYVLRPRRGLGQASPSLEAPRLQALETRDFFPWCLGGVLVVSLCSLAGCCWSLVGLLLVCWFSLVGLLLVSCWSLAGLLLVSCWSLAGLLLVSCWSLSFVSCCFLAAFLLLSCCFSSIVRWCLGGVCGVGVLVMSWWCPDGNQNWQAPWQS